jgi:hypothetical protein
VDLPARHTSVRELISMNGDAPFLADVKRRQVTYPFDEQVLNTLICGWDRPFVEFLAERSPEIGVSSETPLLGFGNEQGPHPHSFRLREVPLEPWSLPHATTTG